ncbi:flippase-like domain-containing protein [Candidatus Woesearchaeota archaeon]|nr:flippase-like domain-containing protein [Candidatus Woesearchaeota archaeon]
MSVTFSIALGLLLLWLVLRVYPFGDVWSAFKNVTWPLLLGYLLVSFFIMLTFAARWNVLLHAQGHKNITFSELLSYRVIDYGVSYVTPTGKLAGEPVRAAMCMRNGISFRQALTSITIDKTIELSFTVIMFAIGCFLLILSHALSGGYAVFLALLCCFLIFVNWTFYNRMWQGKPIFIALFRFLNLDRLKFLSKYEHAIAEFEKPIIRFYNEERKAYFYALGLTILAFSLSMVEYHFLLKMVGVAPSLGKTFMVFSVVGMSFLIPVPMGLGSLEFMQAWLFRSLALGSAAGVGLAMITRARDMIWVLVALGLAFYYGSLKKVFGEAFNAHYANPVVKLTVFRGGKQDFLDMKLFRKKPLEKHKISYMDVDSLKKRYDFIFHKHKNRTKDIFNKKSEKE